MHMEPLQPIPPNNPADDQAWRDVFTGHDAGLRMIRRFWLRIPSNPRCKLCASPFGGVGGGLARIFWHAPTGRNPLLCRACDGMFRKHPGGAEIEVSVLFADVRAAVVFLDDFAGGALPCRFEIYVTDRVGDRLALRGVDAAQDL